MGVVLLILKIIGLALLCVLTLLVIALFVPVTAAAGYDDKGLIVTARVFGFPINVYPMKEKKKKEKKPKEPKEEKPKSDEKTPKKKLDVELIKGLVPPALKSMRFALKHIKLKRVTVSIVVDGDEPDEIGVDAGRWWALFGSVRAALAGCKNIELERLEAIPNFLNEELYNSFSLTVWAMPITMLAAGIVFLKYWLKYKLSVKKETTLKEQVA